MRSLVFPALLGCSVVLMLAMLLAVFEVPAQPARARVGSEVAGGGLLTATPTTVCPPAWRIISSPNPPDSVDSELFGVTTVSSNDVWAVGKQRSSTSDAR